MDDLPPLNALRAFDAAGRHLNFRRASEDLGVTQGAVSQHVRQLEAHLGLALFERLPRGLAFTPEGRAYHVEVSEAFQALVAATQTLKPQPGKVMVSVTPTFAAKWLIPNLGAFAEAHPDIDLRVMATEALSRFHSDGIDLAIRQGQPPARAALDVDLLFRQDIVAVANPAMIAAHPSLSLMPKLHDAHNLWPEFLKHLGLTDSSARNLHFNQTALAVDAAVAGQGAALVSRFLVARELTSGQLCQTVPDHLNGGQDFYLLAQRSRKVGGAVDVVRDWLLAQAD